MKMCRSGQHEMTSDNKKKTKTGWLCRQCVKLRRDKNYVPIRQGKRKEFCKHGHKLTSENRGSDGSCKKCNALRELARRKRIREAKPPKTMCKNGHFIIKAGRTKDNRCAECKRENGRKRNKNLCDSYVVGCMRASIFNVPKELLEIARLNIILKREVRNHGN